MLEWPAKDPDEKLDYRIDWSGRLFDDTVVSSSFSLVSGDVVIDNELFDDVSATVWLKGGTVRSVLTNRVSTVGGRIMEQSVAIRIKEK